MRERSSAGGFILGDCPEGVYSSRFGRISDLLIAQILRFRPIFRYRRSLLGLVGCRRIPRAGVFGLVCAAFRWVRQKFRPRRQTISP